MNTLLHASKLMRRSARRNRSTIMSLASVFGVVGTFISTIAANHKANEARHVAQAEKGENLTTVEIVKAEAPSYVLPGLICTATSVLIVVNDILNVKQRNALIAGSVALSKLYSDYKNDDRTKELAHEEFQKNATSVKDGEFLFYDSWSKRFFKATKEEVLLAESHVNIVLADEFACALNEWYAYLDKEELPTLISGDDFGWSFEAGIQYGYSYVDFTHSVVLEDNGTEYYIIDFTLPTADYLFNF